MDPGLPFLDRPDFRLSAAHLGGDLDRRAFDLLLALGQGRFAGVQGLLDFVEFGFVRRLIGISETHLLGLRLNLRSSRCDLAVEVAQLLRRFLDRGFAARRVGDLGLQVFCLVLKLLLQGLEVSLTSPESPLLVVERLPLLLVVLLDHRDLRVVRLQDLPLVHGRRRRDDVQEGSSDFRRHSPREEGDHEEEVPGREGGPGRLFDPEPADDEQHREDREDEGRHEAPDFPYAQALPRHPHRDDRERNARDSEGIDPWDDPGRQALAHLEDDREGDDEEEDHACG